MVWTLLVRDLGNASERGSVLSPLGLFWSREDALEFLLAELGEEAFGELEWRQMMPHPDVWQATGGEKSERRRFILSRDVVQGDIRRAELPPVPA